MEVDAAQVVRSSQISLHHFLLDGKPKNQHGGVAFLQVSAPFAGTRQIIVQSCQLSLRKLGQYTVLCIYGHLWQVSSCMREPVCLALIRH